MRDIFEHGLMAASMLFMLVFHAWTLVLLLRERRPRRRADALPRRGDAVHRERTSRLPISSAFALEHPIAAPPGAVARCGTEAAARLPETGVP
jgi:hypothetical protein